MHGTLSHLKRFIHWLAGQPGYRSRLQYSDADYFNLSEKDVRIATAKREQVGPTLEQIRYVLAHMPTVTDIQKRDRALIALTILIGARDRAIASLKLKHVDLTRGCVEQDARQVNTKFSKTFTSCFFPVGDDVRQVIDEWVSHLREALLWGDDDPLFPATRMIVGTSRKFEVAGLERAHWSSAARIRAVFRHAFTDAGLPYFNPHSFRHTLVRLGQVLCKTPEEFKAWSQNLGHENVLTTLTSYGPVALNRQAEIIQALAESNAVESSMQVENLAKALLREMQGAGIVVGGGQ